MDITAQRQSSTGESLPAASASVRLDELREGMVLYHATLGAGDPNYVRSVEEFNLIAGCG